MAAFSGAISNTFATGAGNQGSPGSLFGGGGFGSGTGLGTGSSFGGGVPPPGGGGGFGALLGLLGGAIGPVGVIFAGLGAFLRSGCGCGCGQDDSGVRGPESCGLNVELRFRTRESGRNESIRPPRSREPGS